jgi:predicted transcriptional regulator
MLTPEQSRAARAWLDWSQDDLAKLAKVSLSTIRDFEKGRRAPISNNLDAIRRALESHGVSFEEDGDGNATGISFRPAG